MEKNKQQSVKRKNNSGGRKNEQYEKGNANTTKQKALIQKVRFHVIPLLSRIRKGNFQSIFFK